MKKLTLTIIVVVFAVVFFTVNAIADDFYVIPTNRVFISWDKKLPDSTRFKLVYDGNAVLDKETGLVWAKNANITGGTDNWQDAIVDLHNLNIDGRLGWRMPTVVELSSLVDESNSLPALPDGHPFTNVQLNVYWTSTTFESDDSLAYVVYMDFGYVFPSPGGKTAEYYIWPVRGPE